MAPLPRRAEKYVLANPAARGIASLLTGVEKQLLEFRLIESQLAA